jgi:uncharacterized protein YndB with AHSA1/START domain
MATSELHLTQVPVMKNGMLIRKPPALVFRAFADPSITSKFWFTQSTGPMTAGAKLTWTWEMYGVSVPVAVKEVRPDERIVFEWGPPDAPSTVELRFTPWEGGTFLQISESGYRGTGDAVVARALDSMGGFALVLAAVKALLEHDLVLKVVADRHPKGLQI